MLSLFIVRHEPNSPLNRLPCKRLNHADQLPPSIVNYTVPQFLFETSPLIGANFNYP